MAHSGAEIHFCEGCRARGVRTRVAAGEEYCEACREAMGEGPQTLAGEAADVRRPTDVGDLTDVPSMESGKVAFVRAEIARWREGGIITARLAGRLLAEYAPREHVSEREYVVEDDWPQVRIPMTPGLVLLYLGGILILSAVIMLVSEIWKDLGEGGQFVLALVPTLALFAVGGWLFRAVPQRRVSGLVLVFFGCVLTPLVLLLGADALTTYHLDTGALLEVAVLTLAVHLAALGLFRSPLLTIPYPCAMLWVWGLAGDLLSHHGPDEWHHILGAVLACGVVLVATGEYLREMRRPAYAAVPCFLGSFATLVSIALLGMDGKQPFWETLTIVASLGALAASVYRKNQTYLFAGAIILMWGIFDFGFEYFKDTIGLPVTLLACGALSIAVGFAVQRVRKEYIVEEAD